VSGNVEFPATVDIVTQENTKANMEKMATPTAFRGNDANVFQASGGKGMPKRTFKDTLTLDKGPDRIDLYYFGRGHTNGTPSSCSPPSASCTRRHLRAQGAAAPRREQWRQRRGHRRHAGQGRRRIKAVDTIITGHSTLMTWPTSRNTRGSTRTSWSGCGRR